MKNHSPELPPVTYKEAIKLLNGLCEGLGDELSKLIIPIRFLSHKKLPLSDFVLKSQWAYSENGAGLWFSVWHTLREIESGAGIKQ